jgi:hypothetical protein
VTMLRGQAANAARQCLPSRLAAGVFGDPSLCTEDRIGRTVGLRVAGTRAPFFFLIYFLAICHETSFWNP